MGGMPLEVNPDRGQQANEPVSNPEPVKPVSSPLVTENNNQQIKIPQLDTQKAIFANAYRDIKNYNISFEHGVGNVVIRHFSFNDSWRIGAEKQTEIAELFVSDPVEIERLRSLLSAKRMLVLSGESGLGKTTTAVYLSSILPAVADSDNSGVKASETYLIPSLDRLIRIDLHEVFESDETTNRVVIFQNAFARGNLDLRSFFLQLNEFSLTEFAAKLSRTNSYLIFTTTTPEASLFLHGHENSDFRHELKCPGDDLLLLGLEKRLVHLARAARSAPERLEELEKPEHKAIIIGRLKTMPRIVRFVESYLRFDSTIAIGADLDDEIRQSEDITHWFQHELTVDFDTWCFTLALGLSQYSADSEGVPWIDFEYLHREVVRCLKRDPELFPSRRNLTEQAPSEASEITPYLTDDVYLERCRAKVIKDPNGLADLIGFCEESYARKLWEILLKHHRRVLTILLPRLCEIAEDHRAEDDSRRRESCARIIGRIGQMDPDRVTLSVMNRWISSEDVRHRSTIGALYQGILASDNDRYRAYFLEVLASLSSTDPNQDQDEQKDRLLTSIAVYSKIGTYDLTLAMKGLERIARDKLAPIMEDVQRIGRLIERTKSEFAQQTSAQDALGLLIFQEMLRDLAERLYAEQGSTFVGVQYAFSALCLTTDPIAVFKELRVWLESSSQATGALVALMFLIQDGIASTLESIQVEVSNGGSSVEERKSCNPITATLMSGRDAVVEMARFLATIFEAFSVTFFLPKQLQDYLRESFLSHLTTWIEEALPIEICRQAMETLLIELMRIHNHRLSKPIDNLLNSRSFLKHEPDLKKAFVNAVLWPPR
jgi:hypothetical protein